MGFNDQVRNMAYGAENKKFIFKDGVRFKRMGGKNPIVFRILPAFDPNNPNPNTSWMPMATPDGNLTEWGRVVNVYRYVGHGQSRKDILSLKGLVDVPDPMEILLQTANAMPEWAYLTKDVGEGKSAIRKSIGRAAPHLLANVWDINQASRDVMLGVFATSAMKAIIDTKKGLVYQRTSLSEEYIKQNYLLQYATGDVTDPNEGPALCVAKGNDKGEMSDFLVYLQTDAQNRVIRRGLDQGQMAQRYNLANPQDFLEIPTEEDIVNQMIATFNMRSPSGYHEYALLRQAFPTFPIPEPPAAPAASNMVAGGFGANPAAQAQQRPSAPIPAGHQFAQPMQTPAPQPQQPVQQPMQQPVQQAPVYQAPIAPAGMPRDPHPGAIPQSSGIPNQLPPIVNPVSILPEAQHAVNNMAAAQAQQIPQAPVSNPVVPGDPIPSVGIPASQFSKEAFLAKLNGNK